MLTLPVKIAYTACDASQRGTLTRMWDYSPGLVVTLAILWCLAAFLVACLVHVRLTDRRVARQRDAYTPLHDTCHETQTVNLRKVV